MTPTVRLSNPSMTGHFWLYFGRRSFSLFSVPPVPKIYRSTVSSLLILRRILLTSKIRTRFQNLFRFLWIHHLLILYQILHLLHLLPTLHLLHPPSDSPS